jgi:hypothetical protein
MVEEAAGPLRGFRDAKPSIRRDLGDGLESEEVVDPWIVCESSSSLAEAETLWESGGVIVPREDGLDQLSGDFGRLSRVCSSLGIPS